jgi:thiamine-monophosphate kinase
MTTSEASLIRKLQAAAPRAIAQARSGLTLGIGDDAALFHPRRGYETVLTCDWFLEDTHFMRDQHPADAVGWKSLARAVSDIAAIGAEPRCFLLSLALPEVLSGRWLDQFLGGLRRASRKLNCALAGGDTTRQPKVLINITVVGEVRARRAALRSGARPGDLIYVSGRLGEADLGLQLLRGRRPIPKLTSALKTAALKKHLYPQPRLDLARWLTKRGFVTSMMDLSDGLSTDLPRLCAASQVGAQIESTQIPAVHFPKWNRSRSPSALSLALNGGDDYELLFTVPPRQARCLPRSLNHLPLTAIGQITCSRSILVLDADDRANPVQSAGWDPFRTPTSNRS